MFTAIYGICTIITALVFIYMAQKNYDNVDIYNWTFLVLILIIVLSYWLQSKVTTPEASSFLFCFIYLDSTILIVAVIFALLHTIGIRIQPWMKILAYGASFIQLAVVWLCADNDLYDQSLRIVDTGEGYATEATYGPLIIIHFIYLGCLMVWAIGALVLGFLRQGSYSRKNLLVYTSALGAGLLIYAIDIAFATEVTMLPVLYTIADVVIALRYDRAHGYDLSFLITEHQKKPDARGYVAIGLRKQFLGTNEKGYDFLPFPKKQRVNEKLLPDDETAQMISRLIDDFEMGDVRSLKFQTGGMTCVCEITHFSISSGGKTQGYLLELRDATEEQRAYDIISSYNERLNAEVVEKTNSIRDIQRKIVLGMADMIENRDNNTGGHVKRTSDIIHIIVDEIIRQGKIPMTEQMAQDIVRAAPTHDLGKISIDSSILNKPGRLTDEEFEIMKTHSPKSGEMVKILLEGVEEDRFVEVAFNVARYHHERWDGRGYPEGLVGTMIPLEARIMAIADVYDALVSKRVYKEPMSFEQSADIMCECMGTQFDPNMKSVFLGCREQLEKYYEANS